MTALTELLDQKLREKFNGNASELARVVGTSQQNISNFLKGDVLRPHYWKAVADALDIPHAKMQALFRDARSQDHYVWRGDPAGPNTASYRSGTNAELDDLGIPYPKTPIPNATVVPKQTLVTTNKMLPVLGMAVGGEDGRYIFNGSVIDYVVCPPSLENVAGAYAVYIDGESMYPRFKPGETAWVHPGKPARRGDDVIVQIHPPEGDDSPPWGYVKELKGWAGNRLILTQHNPAIDIEFDRQEVITIHPIVLSGKY